MPYQLNYNKKIDIKTNKLYALVMPYSEVCSFMRIAGTVKLIELLPDTYSVQLYNLDGTLFSFPIGYSEAGIYRTSEYEFYSYEPLFYSDQFRIPSALAKGVLKVVR